MDATSRTISEGPQTNIRKTDIIFELKPREKGALSSTGLLDKRLFTGHNKLHAIMNNQNCLWRLKYDQGITPLILQQQFTSFSKLHTFIKNYLNNRNVDIVEIKD